MIRVLHLHGSAHNLGQQHGEQVADLRPQILAAMQARLRKLRSQVGNYSEPVRAVEQVWEEYAPTTLEMLKGITSALDLDWGDFFPYTIASYLGDHKTATSDSEGCTNWAVKSELTRDGAPILAKNRDCRSKHRALQCLAQVQPEGGIPYLCLTSAGSPGVFSGGINRAGLAIADTHVTSTDTGPGIARYSWMMELLESFSTVQEAIDHVSVYPHFGDGTVVAADALGDLAVFEIAHSVQVVRRPSEGFLVSTNHFTAQETSHLWVDNNPAALQGNSAERLRKVEGALRLARGKVDVAWGQELMAQHGDREAICQHRRPGSSSETIASVLFFPRQAALSVTNGPPCQAPFEGFTVEG